jgi:iron complex transport system substrate-binding protein
MSDAYPSRIVCLTEEPTEVLYALGEERRIVGISGFTVRPRRARHEKPRVSAFISAKFDEILALEPDLAIGFSDLQADIARELVRRGVEVWISNHRSVAGILAYVRRLAALVRIAGGDDVFPELAAARLAKDRIVADPAEVVRRRPDVIFASWCGKKFVPARVAARPGWDELPAVRDGELHDVPSPLILQPGPAALTDGLDALHAVIARWAARP